MGGVYILKNIGQLQWENIFSIHKLLVFLLEKEGEERAFWFVICSYISVSALFHWKQKHSRILWSWYSLDSTNAPFILPIVVAWFGERYFYFYNLFWIFFLVRPFYIFFFGPPQAWNYSFIFIQPSIWYTYMQWIPLVRCSYLSEYIMLIFPAFKCNCLLWFLFWCSLEVRYHLDEDPKTLKVFPIPLHDARGTTLQYDRMSLSPDGNILAATHGSTLQWLSAESGQVLDSAEKAHDGICTFQQFSNFWHFSLFPDSIFP